MLHAPLAALLAHLASQGAWPQGTGAAAAPLLLSDAKSEFVRQHPEYGYNGWLEQNWERELGARLGGDHYLDYTGSGQYCSSQLRACTDELAAKVYGNPHSTNPSSALAWSEVEAARALVLRHFNADPAEYAVVFTRSATDGLKLVGESFPWTPSRAWRPPPLHVAAAPGAATDAPGDPVTACGAFREAAPPPGPGGRWRAGSGGGSTFVYLRANHKSVLGIGAYAKDRGSALACVDEAGMEGWLRSAPPPGAGVYGGGGGGGSGGGDGGAVYSLVAYPSLDNYEGRLYPLDWIDKIHARSTPDHRWLVVLDAAAHAPTHPLDLSRAPADFVPVSFYKMFGYPTGVGALLVRRDAAAALRPVYFGGGSTVDATAEDSWRIPLPPPEGLEAGTLPFLAIAELKHGFALLDELGGMQAVAAHVESLRSWTYQQLSQLVHSNGAPALKIFGAHGEGPGAQGGIFEFLVLRPGGSAVAGTEVLGDACRRGLHLRIGCHCNPGQCLYDLGIRPEEERARSLGGYVDFITVMRPDPEGGGRPVAVQLPTGSVRASLGSFSRFEDVAALVGFLREAYVE